MELRPQIYNIFLIWANKIAENVKILRFLGVKYGGQAAVESLREVECARHRLCAFGGCEDGQQSCGVVDAPKALLFRVCRRQRKSPLMFGWEHKWRLGIEFFVKIEII